MALSFRAALARVNDSRSIAHGVVSTTLTAALTLVEPRRLGHGSRVAYRVAVAGVTAWTTWASMRSEGDDAVAPATRAGVTVGAAGVALGLADAGEALDARITDGLVRAGATRPRLILAAAAAALSIGSWMLGRRASESITLDEIDEIDDIAAEADEPVEVPEEVRALVARLLGADERFGAAELRAQLESARAVVYEGPEPDAFWPGIGFAVPVHLPLAVPGDANFPVIGRYRALGGRTFDVYLAIQDGRIATLAISEGRDWSEGDIVAWLDADRGMHELPGWPDADELELLIETPNGLRPIL